MRFILPGKLRRRIVGRARRHGNDIDVKTPGCSQWESSFCEDDARVRRRFGQGG
jgi:hypothetical protein